MKALSSLMPGKETAFVARRAGMILPAPIGLNHVGPYAALADLHADWAGHNAGMAAAAGVEVRG